MQSPLKKTFLAQFQKYRIKWTNKDKEISECWFVVLIICWGLKCLQQDIKEMHQEIDVYYGLGTAIKTGLESILKTTTSLF